MVNDAAGLAFMQHLEKGEAAQMQRFSKQEATWQRKKLEE
jgi:hypothetical protein